MRDVGEADLVVQVCCAGLGAIAVVIASGVAVDFREGLDDVFALDLEEDVVRCKRSEGLGGDVADGWWEVWATFADVVVLLLLLVVAVFSAARRRIVIRGVRQRSLLDCLGVDWLMQRKDHGRRYSGHYSARRHDHFYFLIVWVLIRELWWEKERDQKCVKERRPYDFLLDVCLPS
mmetsp:Transcript_38597/g.80898  ORF Transcript_38597/g.80898 Transcript_38597/m.80898 type:complete len:176 (+) Transcript_38597:1002-1529(+)